jgi:hypothetical protein
MTAPSPIARAGRSPHTGDRRKKKRMLEMTERSQYVVENKGSAQKTKPKRTRF